MFDTHQNHYDTKASLRMIYIIILKEWLRKFSVWKAPSRQITLWNLVWRHGFYIILKMSASRYSEVSIQHGDAEKSFWIYIEKHALRTLWHSPLNRWWRHCLLSYHHGSSSAIKKKRKKIMKKTHQDWNWNIDRRCF